MPLHVDFLVIGSGPAGQRAAIQAAKSGKRVGLVERKPKLGGAGLQTGTIPSKALREVAYTAAVTGRRGMRSVLAKAVLPDHFLDEAVARKDSLLNNQESVILNQLLRNGVTLIPGQAHFVGAHTMRVHGPGRQTRMISADHIIMATGARPRRPDDVPFDKTHVLDSTSILNLRLLPKSLTVVGGGVIACELATIYASLGVQVAIVDSHAEILMFLDKDISQTLHESMQLQGIKFYMNARIKGIARDGDSVCTTLADGCQLHADRLLYALGRIANVGDLGLEDIGIHMTERGWVAVNDNFQTSHLHIYAVGDMIGPPALAAVGMEQGRLAALHAVGQGRHREKPLLPVGIYTIPEISAVGKCEHELKAAGIDYVCGTGFYRETARGQITGDSKGYLKLLICPESRQLLGVHIIGESASELLHIGQLAMSMGTTVDNLAAHVFNYPTYAECYKTAALDCYNQLGVCRTYEKSTARQG